MIPMISTRILRRVAASAAFLALVAVPPATLAQAPNVERFTAKTTNMSPDGEMLRIDVLKWSSDGERNEVVALLGDDYWGGDSAAAETDEAGDGEDPEVAFRHAMDVLPTVGYVWPGSSSLGFSVKYAERATGPDGGERITLVTSRRLGDYALEPWKAADASREVAEPFTVIVLRLGGDGTGDGTMSFAAEPLLNPVDGTVSLAQDETAPVLLMANRGQQSAWPAEN